MREEYTRQALPPRKYRELLGTAICVFNSNNSFIIENVLRVDDENYNYYELIDKSSGELEPIIKKTITARSNTNIAKLFSLIVSKRNRIIHSFQITEEGNQILRTKNLKHKQFTITEDILLEFINLNEKLSSTLHEFRNTLKPKYK